MGIDLPLEKWSSLALYSIGGWKHTDDMATGG